jgi:DNA primase
MKGFDHGEEKRTLYNLDLLEKKPLAPIIVVEGEKTADAAPDKLKEIRTGEHVAVTWHGGCKAVSKTDWTPLAGRDVLIWPDNDKCGFQAAKEIERALLRVGAKEIKTIDNEWLSKNFEEKWDLADDLPKQITNHQVLVQLKGVKLHSFRDHFFRQTEVKNKSFPERCALSDLAASYIKGRSERIETVFQGKELFEKNKILYDAAYAVSKALQKEPETLKHLSEDPHINASGDLTKQLATQCILFELKTSREPTLSETLVMKETIEEAEKKLAASPTQDLSREVLFSAKQRTFEKLCDRSLERGVNAEKMQNINQEIFHESKEIAQAEQQELKINKAVEKQQEMERQVRIDRGPSMSW